MTNGNVHQEKLTCQEIVELVTDYLESALLPRTQTLFEEHVAGCPGCTNYIDQVQKTIDMLRKLTQEPVFPERKEELLEIFREWKLAS
jgi:predicted anti-sigma-YlaC factor YlaD